MADDDLPKVIGKVRVVRWPDFSAGKPVAIYPEQPEGVLVDLMGEGETLPDALRNFADRLESGKVERSDFLANDDPNA